ncbi:hypothetical protein HMPREF1587_01754 [Bifidobacterium breve JCP7499]|nr:hypothetical protein HMPREF1587_01754 [Bifidobacterium breve JCP7499]
MWPSDFARNVPAKPNDHTLACPRRMCGNYVFQPWKTVFHALFQPCTCGDG